MMKTPKNDKLNKSDRIAMKLLAPARAAAERMGYAEFTRELHKRLGMPYQSNRINEVRTWLTANEWEFRHPRAGVAHVMLEIAGEANEKGQPLGHARNATSPASLMMATAPQIAAR